MERPEPRTLLEQLVQQDDRSLDEIAADYGKLAHQLKERRATLSIRQLGRWMAGEVANARPASRRVARKFWGYTFTELLSPPRDQANHLIDRASGQLPAVLVASDVNGSWGAVGRDVVSLHEELVMAADESARFVRRAGIAITPETLEQLDADVRQLAVEYLRRPPYAIFRPLASLRREVFAIIDNHPRPEYLTDLYKVAGQLSALLAHASSDLGQAYAADSHTRTAWLCADLASDTTLRAYIRWIQSNVAYWRGDYQEAAEIARDGQRHVGEGSGLLRLTSQEARALAATGDGRGVDHALALAGEAREYAEAETLSGVFHFAPGKAAYYASEVRVALGGEANYRRAVGDAEEALTLFERDGERSAELVAAAQLDLVAAHLALDDLEAGSIHIQPVLELAAESRTVPIIERMSKIDHSLTLPAFRSARSATDLREQISLFCAYPAARELPQLPA